MLRFAALLVSLPIIAQVPVAKREPVTDTIHGVKLTDPYRWLEDQNSAATRSWIDQEVKYTKSVLGKLPFRDRLRDRLKALQDIEVVDMPIERAGRYFFRHRAPGQDQSVLEMRDGIHGQNQVLLDPNPWSPDHTTSVSVMDVSHDGRLLIYGKRQGGEDEVVPALFDVDARKTVGETFPKATSSALRSSTTSREYTIRTSPKPARASTSTSWDRTHRTTS